MTEKSTRGKSGYIKLLLCSNLVLMVLCIVFLIVLLSRDDDAIAAHEHIELRDLFSDRLATTDDRLQQIQSLNKQLLISKASNIPLDQPNDEFNNVITNSDPAPIDEIEVIAPEKVVEEVVVDKALVDLRRKEAENYRAMRERIRLADKQSQSKQNVVKPSNDIPTS